MVVGGGRVLVMVSLVVVAIGETWWVMVLVLVMMMVREMIIRIPLILLLPGLLPKAMSNRVQNLHLSEVLLPY